jgi:ribonuclease III
MNQTDPIPISNPQLLTEALTHRSFLNESKSATVHNERLEFLGDAVLELVVSEYLYHQFPTKPEGDLTAYRASLVKTTTLAQVAKDLQLGTKLRLSKGEELSGGRTNPSLLANTVESVIGAIYLDQGLEAAELFVNQHLFPRLNDIITRGLHKDHKSALQEKVQANGSESPEYRVDKESGPDHNKEFTISVYIDSQKIASGTGKSKQSAQQDAARHALEKLGIT